MHLVQLRRWWRGLPIHTKGIHLCVLLLAGNNAATTNAFFHGFVSVRYSARLANTLSSIADLVFAGLAFADQIHSANGSPPRTSTRRSTLG
ncbi:hypothetical protein GUJ93_ZPchr0004g40509 [Zizania palustris]|uniref:Uncharacterized protein n=1 Tax=Zizania palustris TaxID=103762 RepID=A0A8J5SRH3_ZIZPA|nr:hypothetical protein GUJ93_ZPchr0004g40509 [Zizania palustris]